MTHFPDGHERVTDDGESWPSDFEERTFAWPCPHCEGEGHETIRETYYDRDSGYWAEDRRGPPCWPCGGSGFEETGDPPAITLEELEEFWPPLA